MAQEKSYIDIRLEVTHDSEIYTLDGEEFEDHYVDTIAPSVRKVKGLSGADLVGIAEALSQLDRYQLMLSNQVPAAIYEYANEQAKNG